MKLILFILLISNSYRFAGRENLAVAAIMATRQLVFCAPRVVPGSMFERVFQIALAIVL